MPNPAMGLNNNKGSSSSGGRGGGAMTSGGVGWRLKKNDAPAEGPAV